MKRDQTVIEVLVDWRKWPDTPYRTTPMTRLGEDEQGIWLFAPRQAAATYAEHGPAPLPASFLTLVPAGGQWWIATWMRDNDKINIDLYVDIVHPPRWTADGSLRVVDLDLDVIRAANGDVMLDDEDELELHAGTLGYPEEVVAAARASAEALMPAIAAHRPPFSAPPARWLAASQLAVKPSRG